MMMDAAKFIPWVPALGAVLCGLCATRKSLRSWAGPIAVLAVLTAFVLSLLTSRALHDVGSSMTVPLWSWITSGGISANFTYFIDTLTILMLFVVTGVGTLVTIYATGYMAGDKGYARFFAFVCLFIFAMTNLVLADNLVLLYLGWEGVGLCSYLLIGYYYQKPSAVAAAKKAFIVNRIGDLGFALGIFLTWMHWDTVSLSEVVQKVQMVAATGADPGWIDYAIPFLLMLGAFGKSAQLPLYVWLPDAMEGPTPVSALIHAATMVTAGVYMIARLLPVFDYAQYALPVVALVGGLTAVFAATIALCQNDLKRVYAYSTISQLGYMFLGVGVLSAVGGVFHLFTHAFFKALLFLTAGSVMHALAGQLDLRKMSGLYRKMPITAVLMLIGCLALAGFPFTAGFYSKDTILAATFEKGLGEHGSWYYLSLGLLGLFTAFLTAFYTFRLWFRVFVGPLQYEMGDEHHDDEEHAQHDDAEGFSPGLPAAHDSTSSGPKGHGVISKSSSDHSATSSSNITVIHHHEPHEMPWLMNAPLVALAIGSLLAGVLCYGWVKYQIAGSTAIALTPSHPVTAPDIHHATTALTPSPLGPVMPAHDHHVTLFGLDLHLAMMLISGAISLLGISLAAYFHWFNRPAGARIAAAYPGLVNLLHNKYYVDEINDLLIVRPLRTLGWVCYIIDRMVIDGLVAIVGFLPRVLGLSLQPSQHGQLQGYGLGMVAGTAVILLLVLWSMM